MKKSRKRWCRPGQWLWYQNRDEPACYGAGLVICVVNGLASLDGESTGLGIIDDAKQSECRPLTKNERKEYADAIRRHAKK